MINQSVIEELVSIFKDTPKIVGQLPDSDWAARNAFIVRLRDNGIVRPVLRVKVEFMDREFPAILKLARYWAELIYAGGWESAIKNSADEDLGEMMGDIQKSLADEKARLSKVWDRQEYFFRELYPEGDTGEWYQILLRSISILNDADLRENIEKIFELIVPLAKEEIEIRDSKKRWTAYKNYQIGVLEEQFRTQKAQMKQNFESRIFEIRSKWSAAAAEAAKTLVEARNVNAVQPMDSAILQRRARYEEITGRKYRIF